MCALYRRLWGSVAAGSVTAAGRSAASAEQRDQQAAGHDGGTVHATAESDLRVLHRTCQQVSRVSAAGPVLLHHCLPLRTTPYQEVSRGRLRFLIGVIKPETYICFNVNAPESVIWPCAVRLLPFVWWLVLMRLVVPTPNFAKILEPLSSSGSVYYWPSSSIHLHFNHKYKHGCGFYQFSFSLFLFALPDPL